MNRLTPGQLAFIKQEIKLQQLGHGLLKGKHLDSYYVSSNRFNKILAGQDAHVGGNLTATLTDPSNRWRYSGKEEQGAIDSSLLLIDYGARMYDPVIARWMSVG